MKFTRAMLAFVAVPAVWAALMAIAGRRLLGGGDMALLVAMSFVAGMIWLAFVNLCVRVLRRDQPATATLYVTTAVIGSGASALVADLVQTHDFPAALELSGGIVVLAAISSLLFVALAGLPWRAP